MNVYEVISTKDDETTYGFIFCDSEEIALAIFKYGYEDWTHKIYQSIDKDNCDK